MAPNSQKEEQSLTPSPTSKTQEPQVAPQEQSKPKQTKAKAKAITPGVTQDSDSHYTIR